MQDKGLHRLKVPAKARRGNGRPGIVPYKEYASKIGGHITSGSPIVA